MRGLGKLRVNLYREMPLQPVGSAVPLAENVCLLCGLPDVAQEPRTHVHYTFSATMQPEFDSSAEQSHEQTASPKNANEVRPGCCDIYLPPAS